VGREVPAGLLEAGCDHDLEAGEELVDHRAGEDGMVLDEEQAHAGPRVLSRRAEGCTARSAPSVGPISHPPAPTRRPGGLKAGPKESFSPPRRRTRWRRFSSAETAGLLLAWCAGVVVSAYRLAPILAALLATACSVPARTGAAALAPNRAVVHPEVAQGY